MKYTSILCWIDVGYIHLLQCGTCKKFQYDKVTTKRKSWLEGTFLLGNYILEAINQYPCSLMVHSFLLVKTLSNISCAVLAGDLLLFQHSSNQCSDAVELHVEQLQMC